eukprot:GHVR01089379.1.p1 GENE.GHVR01089379.1~~GHVR01089379.1.p1  ORF type:complete len:123 (+),score=4.07 GHVR01089379.1:163-531(+)
MIPSDTDVGEAVIDFNSLKARRFSEPLEVPLGAIVAMQRRVIYRAVAPNAKEILGQIRILLQNQQEDLRGFLRQEIREIVREEIREVVREELTTAGDTGTLHLAPSPRTRGRGRTKWKINNK